MKIQHSKLNTHNCRRPAACGFTLLEILIAIVILAVVLSTIYASYTGTLRVIRDLETGDRIYSMARSSLDRMMIDLSCAGAYEEGSDFGTRRDPSGKAAGSLTFISTAATNFENNTLLEGIAKITYYLEQDLENGGYNLMRREEPLDAKSPSNTGSQAFILCRGLQSMAFRFYDSGGKEYDSWDSAPTGSSESKPLPRAVAIHLTFENPADRNLPYRFMTKILLAETHEGA
jgi:prepilin-type N-terminal cleavage/methylation domain-containing protein